MEEIFPLVSGEEMCESAKHMPVKKSGNNMYCEHMTRKIYIACLHIDDLHNMLAIYIAEDHRQFKY